VARPDVRRAPAPGDRAVGGDGLPLGRREPARRPRAGRRTRLAQGLALAVVMALWGAYLARSWEQLAGYQWRIASGLLGLAALGWYVLANLVSGVAFWLLVLSLGGAGPLDLLRLTGAYALAYAVGYLSFLTPAGLGAREAALVVLLGGLVAPPVAVAASLLARATSALGEVLGVAALGLFSARSIIGPKSGPDSR